MLLDELKHKSAELNSLSARYGASNLRVFGSVARGEETPQSDVDFLVDLPRGYDMFLSRLPLAEELSLLLNRDVDLIPSHELNRHIKNKILSEAVAL